MNGGKMRIKSTKGSIKSGKLEFIYTGVEASKDCFANAVECIGGSDEGVLLRFFHQRPTQRSPITYQADDQGIRVQFGNFDTMEFALQTSVMVNKSTAIGLLEQLTKILDDNDAPDEE